MIRAHGRWGVLDVRRHTHRISTIWQRTACVLTIIFVYLRCVHQREHRFLQEIHKNAIFSCESLYFAFGAEATERQELRRELLSSYFGAIAAMDRGIGEIYKELEKQNLPNDTIIIFTSDNGMNTGHHGIWGKGNGTYPQNMYDTSVKIPFIMSCPGFIEEDTVKHNLYSHYDLFPTLVEMLHLKLSREEKDTMEGLPGRSYFPDNVPNENGYTTNLPRQCAAMNMSNITAQDLAAQAAITGDVELAYWAIARSTDKCSSFSERNS